MLTAYFASIVVTFLLTGSLAAYAWRHRTVPGSHAYAALALEESLLALSEMLSMLSPAAPQALFFFRLRYTLSAAISILWLLFALEYSGRRTWLTPRLMDAADPSRLHPDPVVDQ